MIIKFKIPIIALSIVLVGLLIALLIVFLPPIIKKDEFKVLSPKEVEERILGYFNTYAPEGVGEIAIIENKEESGVYKLKLKAQGEEFEAYVTKDGKLLFLAFVDLTQAFPSK